MSEAATANTSGATEVTRSNGPVAVGRVTKGSPFSEGRARAASVISRPGAFLSCTVDVNSVERKKPPFAAGLCLQPRDRSVCYASCTCGLAR